MVGYILCTMFGAFAGALTMALAVASKRDGEREWATYEERD